MRLFQAPHDTCLGSPFLASLSVHGLHFTAYAASIGGFTTGGFNMLVRVDLGQIQFLLVLLLWFTPHLKVVDPCLWQSVTTTWKP